MSKKKPAHACVHAHTCIHTHTRGMGRGGKEGKEGGKGGRCMERQHSGAKGWGGQLSGKCSFRGLHVQRPFHPLRASWGHCSLLLGGEIDSCSVSGYLGFTGWHQFS